MQPQRQKTFLPLLHGRPIPLVFCSNEKLNVAFIFTSERSNCSILSTSTMCENIVANFCGIYGTVLLLYL
uniref:Uncharacterized protein n=1 Tax=Parascaris equorum TaxID=6256 RepID=A0A914S356_PAREQ